MPDPLPLAVVLFPGFETLDVMGPVEMFGMHPETFPMTFVAEIPGPVVSAQGQETVATGGLDDQSYDMVLVPGGPGARQQIENKVLLDWIARQAGEAGKASIIASVCTGSAILASSGVLDGRRATTNKLAFDWVAGLRDQVEWVRHARWVDDGKFWTSSGVSAGMDMALALVAHHMDRAAAEQAALWAEYIWNDDPDDDPFAKALP